MGISLGVIAAEASRGSSTEPETVSIQGPETYNGQRHGSFSDPRGAGTNSLTSSADKMNADDKVETHAFTEADGSLAKGLLLHGSLWGRVDDSMHMAFMRSTLSAQRRRFLASGGASFFIGDGYLDYKPESIIETFYSRSVARVVGVTLDYQHVANPATTRPVVP